MTTQRQTKGLRIDGFGTVVMTGTSCNGGPGESPYIVLDIRGKEWTWFAPTEDVLWIPRGETVMIGAFGYEDDFRGARLRRVSLTRILDDGSCRHYGMKGN